MDPIVIGTGELWWQSGERHTDRYGAVHLNDRDHVPQQIDTGLVGSHGRLVAVIERPYRGTSPVSVGDAIELGTGTLFVETSPLGNTEVGVKPTDGRAENWLDGNALTVCHGQVVRLEFHSQPLTVGEFKIQFSEPDGDTEHVVFFTRTTTQVVEVRVPHSELDHTHDPDNVDALRRAVVAHAREKHSRGETQPVVGPVHETDTTWDLAGPRADRTRKHLIDLYTSDDTPDDI